MTDHRTTLAKRIEWVLRDTPGLFTEPDRREPDSWFLAYAIQTYIDIQVRRAAAEAYDEALAACGYAEEIGGGWNPYR